MARLEWQREQTESDWMFEDLLNFIGYMVWTKSWLELTVRLTQLIRHRSTFNQYKILIFQHWNPIWKSMFTGSFTLLSFFFLFFFLLWLLKMLRNWLFLIVTLSRSREANGRLMSGFPHDFRSSCTDRGTFNFGSTLMPFLNFPLLQGNNWHSLQNRLTSLKSHLSSVKVALDDSGFFW